MITCRLLPRAEWDRLSPIFAEYGGSLPQIGEIAVSEAEGEIVGMLVLQLVPHAEPLWIKQGWRGKVSFRRLFSELDKLFSPGDTYFSFVPSARIARVAELAQMQKKDWMIWERTVQ